MPVIFDFADLAKLKTFQSSFFIVKKKTYEIQNLPVLSNDFHFLADLALSSLRPAGQHGATARYLVYVLHLNGIPQVHTLFELITDKYF